MSNSKQHGFEVGLKAQAMASPERVQSVLTDDKKFWELVADLASFEKVARRVAERDEQYEQAAEGIILAISFISHVRHTNKEFYRSGAGN